MVLRNQYLRVNHEHMYSRAKFVMIGLIAYPMTTAGELDLVLFCSLLCCAILFVTFKDALKRSAVGVWKCKGCRKVIAGGAWAPQ